MKDRLAVYMLDVGQGDSTIVLLPDDPPRGADGTVVRDVDEIAESRRRVLTQHHQWIVPQYRHLTDKRGEARVGQLEVPCAGTVVVNFHLDGRREVLPAPGGGHESVVDGWERPLCRALTPSQP